MHLALFLLQQPDPAEIQRIVLGFMAIMPILFLIGAAIVVIPVWFICKKAGFSPWLSLLYAIPPCNIVLLYVLAFSNWKVVPAPQTPYMPPSYPPYPPQA